MAKSCTICGEDIDAENQPYVVANRRVYHLHHEDKDSIKTEEYEQIVATLKGQLKLHTIEVNEKNKVILKLTEGKDHWEKMTVSTNEEYTVLQEQHKKILDERHRCHDELSIYKTDYAALRKETEKLKHDIDSSPPPEETFKVEEENVELKNESRVQKENVAIVQKENVDLKKELEDIKAKLKSLGI